MDTIVAAITAPVASPVIVVRISGSDSLNVFNIMRHTNGGAVDKTIITPNLFSLYNFSTSEGLRDQVLAVYFKSPKSFTGEDTVEISFHGNPLLLHSAFSEFYKLGFRPALPGEFSKRAFVNGKIDLTQAEAIQELIAAKTSKGVYYAYEQLTGSVRNKLDSMKRQVLELKAITEAVIDFPEEDTTDDVLSAIKTSVDNIIHNSSALLDAYKSLRLKGDKISLVLAGKPNVGKSSLLNALLMEDRAIVSDIAGTTRDFIREDLYLGGLPLEIVDTAGVRTSVEGVEAAGIEKSIAKIRTADVVILLLDLSAELTQEDHDLLKQTELQNRIIVGNKADKSVIDTQFADICVSAMTGFNMEGLIGLIKSKAESFDLADNSTAVAIVCERHFFLLSEAVDTLIAMTENLDKLSLDMVACDLDFVLNKFKEITGETYTEEVLDIIFSKFCIGK